MQEQRFSGSVEIGESKPFYRVKRADLDRVLEEERLAEEARARAARIEHPGPTLEERLSNGASKFRAWRESRGLTLHELSTATGIPVRHLDQIEHRTRSATQGQVEAIAATLEIEVSALAVQ